MSDDGTEALSGDVPAKPVGRRTYTTPTGDVVPMTWENIRRGVVPLEALDDEEVARLQLRRSDGTFAGGKPSLVPRELADAHARELLGRNTKLLREVLLKGTEVFIEVMDDSNASAADRMKAAQYLHDRLLGPAKQTIEVRAEIKPWEAAAQNIIMVLSDTVALEPGVTGQDTQGDEHNGSN